MKAGRLAISVSAALGALATCLAGLHAYQKHRAAVLPYSDQFARERADEWSPFGGHWHFENDAIVGQGVERGAKLVTGSTTWTNYQLSADVQLRGRSGDAGIVVRLTDPAEGIESYRGYYAGLRVDDSAVVLGRSNGHWLSVFPVSMSEGVHPGVWYRIHAVAVGCRIAVEAVNLSTGDTGYAGLQDSPSDCLTAGRIGLRMTASGGAWKNVRVAAANESDLHRVAQHVSKMDRPAFPIREREYNEMRQSYLSHVLRTNLLYPPEDSTTPEISFPNDVPLLTVDALRSHIADQTPIHIVGVITSANPLYIQDATAGVRLDSAWNFSFHIGDQVDMLGSANITSGLLTLVPLRVRILWDRSPIDPISTNSTLAATGRFDGTFVELSGNLNRKTALSGGVTELELRDGAQQYVVRIPPDLFATSSTNYENGSRLRVRGICSTGVNDKPDDVAFVLYANSPSDILYLTGPPWWTGKRLFCIVCAIISLSVAGVWLFFRIERAQTQIVFAERERLSHELHDTLAQSLAGVGFKLQGIIQTLHEIPRMPTDVVDEVESTYQMVSGTHREASDTIAALHPASRREGDLLTLLERSLFSMLDKDALPVHILRKGEPRAISPAVADALFRIGREALANILHHSRATEVTLSLTYHYRELILTISDNGTGFDVAQQKYGFGLKSMTKRSADIHARMEIVSSPGNGCAIQVTSPYRAHGIFSPSAN